MIIFDKTFVIQKLFVYLFKIKIMFKNLVLEKEFNLIEKKSMVLNSVGGKSAITIDGWVNGSFVSESYLYSEESDRNHDYNLIKKHG